jgi:hypothetical protein
MSLYRFIYYSAVVGGWAAFLAWWLAETLFCHSAPSMGEKKTIAMVALVGAAMGAGLNLVAGMSNGQWKRQLARVLPGLVTGGIGGAFGVWFGNALFVHLHVPRAIGWMIMGLAIGCADGLYEQSGHKIRNGLLGGALGGFLGGLMFDLIARLGAGMSSRAIGFVILGLAIGAMTGLAQVVLKDAWLTVLDGFRPGRQLILSQSVTALGRGDHLPLPFLGYPGRDLETEHLRIVRRPDGGFVVEDNQSRLGTYVNGQRIMFPTAVHDGDLIRLGSNIVRFNHRQRLRGAGAPVAASIQPPPSSLPPPPFNQPPQAAPPPLTQPAANVVPPGPTPQGIPPRPAAPPPRPGTSGLIPHPRIPPPPPPPPPMSPPAG